MQPGGQPSTRNRKPARRGPSGPTPPSVQPGSAATDQTLVSARRRPLPEFGPGCHRDRMNLASLPLGDGMRSEGDHAISSPCFGEQRCAIQTSLTFCAAAPVRLAVPTQRNVGPLCVPLDSPPVLKIAMPGASTVQRIGFRGIGVATLEALHPTEYPGDR